MAIAASAAARLNLRSTTLVHLLHTQAARQPDRRIFTFLLDGASREQHLTYGELDCQARGIAARLQSIGAAGERALLVQAPGLDYIATFFGCLYAGVVPIPAYPPRLNRSLDRLQAIAADAGAALALTTSDILAGINRQLPAAPELADLQWLSADGVSHDNAEDWREPAITGESLALLQYTSGSTASPKGVMLTHEHLLANLATIEREIRHTPDTRSVSWLPPYHDMGLIGGILLTCYTGAFTVLMAPVSFLQHPFYWLRAISHYRASASAAPNFAYDLCVRKVTAEQRETLDLSCWEKALNGAEPVRAETIERFAATFGPHGFRRQAFLPCYGLAEASLYVCGHAPLTEPRYLSVRRDALEQHRVVNPDETGNDTAILVSCGQVPAEHQIRIVDPETLKVRAPDEIGEIWVAGPSVADGYWGRAEENNRTFRAVTADTAEGPFLRTGDLGFLHDGEVFITGRIKDLIISDGRNHYPQDIELTAELSHPLIRPSCCAAFSIDVDHQERIVVVAEVDRGYRSLLAGTPAGDGSADPVKKAILRAVATEHDLRVHDIALLKPGGLPKTSSGKVQRHACRAGYLSGTLDTWRGE